MYKWFIRILSKVPGAGPVLSFLFKQKSGAPGCDILDLNLKNQVGLDSGMDDTGDFSKILYGTGVSFSTIGPIHSGNVTKAISRIIANRDYRKRRMVAVTLGSSSYGDNDDNILKEYVRTFSLVYDFADLFFIDFSRRDTDPAIIRSVTSAILETRFTYEEYKPIIISTGKTLEEPEIQSLVDFCRMNGADAVDVWGPQYVKLVHEYSGGRFPVFGHGGIDSPRKAAEFIDNGAAAVILREEIATHGLSYPGKIINYLTINNQNTI